MEGVLPEVRCQIIADFYGKNVSKGKMALNADYEGTKKFIGIIMTPSNFPHKINTN